MEALRIQPPQDDRFGAQEPSETLVQKAKNPRLGSVSMNRGCSASRQGLRATGRPWHSGVVLEIHEDICLPEAVLAGALV